MQGLTPKCGVRVSPSPPTQAPPGGLGLSTMLKVKEKPRMGFIASLFGALIIFIAAIVYFALGNATAGIVGIVFVIASGIFAYMGYVTLEKKKQQLYGAIPMLIGFIIMIATGTLLGFDIVVLIGGFIIAIGGILITSGK